jgi:hypothetical protein
MKAKVPFAFEMYGEIEVEVKDTASREDVLDAAKDILEAMSLYEMLNVSDLLLDSDQIDSDGIIYDETNNIIFED